jgi:tetratricopeptide (TPR) repeat protein
MSFDKSKAMRNAERYVAQGKIRAAISEYRAVVDNDPRDIATLNMLGDLYAKSAEKRDAVNCYLQVADHYSTQGFAQKAIAVYNKITRIQPDSIEVSAKLAELHKVKGSLSEARSHYMTLAEHYENNGHPLEALSMYKQIALLDPNNTEVCLNLAEAYIREGQRDEAVEAYAEAGARFSRQNKQEEAIRALTKGFDIKSTDLRVLNGLIKAQTALGRAGKAASLLEEILENEPYNRDVLYLLIECCIDSQNAAGAEKAIIKLVEIEPANYSKFLDLVRIYLNGNDPASAARILTMSAEYLLAGGQSEECGKWINEILEREPGQLAGLRLLVRYYSWMNNPNGFGNALERLFAAAADQKSVDDERIALSQLVVIKPQETRFHDRLREINEEFGYDEHAVDEEKLRAEFGILPADKLAEDTNNAAIYAEDNWVATDVAESDPVEGNGRVVEAAIVQEPSGHESNGRSHAAEQKIQKELESISFYIENDYHELAEKALGELRREFGDRPEFDLLPGHGVVAPESTAGAPIVEANAIGIDEIRSEFGIQGTEAEAEKEDYETHYQMAVAYQEMGLMEEAIREFQDAISLTEPADGSRRFFQCGYLLGHCFLQSGKPHHAITWITRTLETPNITDEEYHGLWYELALAYEANGEEATAAVYFEKIYAENVDFRDVGERVKNSVPSV